MSRRKAPAAHVTAWSPNNGSNADTAQKDEFLSCFRRRAVPPMGLHGAISEFQQETEIILSLLFSKFTLIIAGPVFLSTH